jgi:hypothetical protein
MNGSVIRNPKLVDEVVHPEENYRNKWLKVAMDQLWDRSPELFAHTTKKMN